MTDQPENPEWFFARDSESVGPISQELLLERLQAGELNAATLVWRDGFSLAFLAPNLIKAATEGRLPRGMGIARLCDMPAEWSRQHETLGLPQ